MAAASGLFSTLLALVSLSLLLLTSAGASLPPLRTAGHSTSLQPPMELHQAVLLLGPILSNLGFQELAMAVPALLSASPSGSPDAILSGHLTLFAPSDDSIRSCGPACTAPRLLLEHLVPGLFPSSYLSRLAFGTKLQTSVPARCLTLTSTAHLLNYSSNSAVKIFVDGVEITHPDLYNDGRVVIHGLQGFVSPLSPLSCDQDLPATTAGSHRSFVPGIAGGDRSAIVRLMLRDAIIRLRDGGFSILAIAMRVKYPELAGLSNMTVFALDDDAIFAGGHAYVANVRFHIVPDRLLMHADLARLPAGTILPTLVRGQHLIVTHAGSPDDAAHGPGGSGLRINYVPFKAPDVVYNTRIVVHSIFLPFPHLYLTDMAAATAEDEGGGIFDLPRVETVGGLGGSCRASAAAAVGGKCTTSPAPAPAVDLEDDGF